MEVDFAVGNPSGSQPVYSVKIYSSTASSSPDAAVATLTNPSSLADGLNTFTATASGYDGEDLDPDTSYFLVLSVTTDGAINGGLSTTQVFEEDAGAAEGWSIADSYTHKARGGSSWTTDATQTLQIRINGYTKLPFSMEVVYETESDDYVVRIRVVRDQYGNCYLQKYDRVWSAGVNYGDDGEACRKAAWDAYRLSQGEEELGPRSGDFPSGQPPALTDFSCPSGWEASTGYGKQWCHLPGQPIDEDHGLSPERARAFLAAGLRPSDARTTNPSRLLDFENFMWGAGICGEGRVIGYTDGGNGGRMCHPADEMVTCTSGNSAGISGRRCVPAQLTQIPLGTSASDPNPPGTGTSIPRKIVTEWDREQGQYVSSRDEDGNIVAAERDNPELACDGYTWLEHLGQWVCSGREYTPSSSTTEEKAPVYVCTRYEQRFYQGHPSYQTSYRCVAEETQEEAYPPPVAVGGPASGVTTIVHTSNYRWPACNEEQLRALDAGLWAVPCDASRNR